MLQHPTFRPPRLTLTQPPFEVRRLGWGYFNIEADIILKEPYSWVQDNTNERRHMLKLDWMLSFEGSGQQGRVRAKVKKIEDDLMDLDDDDESYRDEEEDESESDTEDQDEDDDEGEEFITAEAQRRSISPTRWPHMDREED
jgi:transcription initiation factor IIF auxiliary subunit